MSVDTVGNFLTTIRNGILLGKQFVTAPYSRMNVGIAQILKDEGFIKDVVVLNIEDSDLKKVNIYLKYVNDESVIHEINRISTPGRRAYKKAKKLKPVIGKLGISILSTSKGLMTDKKAKELSVGGEVLCSVW